MSNLTLDEAIKHCLEVAENNELKRNEYDMLMDMQTRLIKGCRCVLDVITGTTVLCPIEAHGKVGEQSRLAVCSKRIQAWLNEEN